MDPLLGQVSEMLSGNTPKVRKAVFMLFENARGLKQDGFLDEGKELEFYFNLSVAILRHPDRVERMLSILADAEDFNNCLMEMSAFLANGIVPEDCV